MGMRQGSEEVTLFLSFCSVPFFPGVHLPTSVPTLADRNIDKNTHADQSS